MALDSMERAVGLDGTEARYRNNLALAQVANGRTEQAIRTFMGTQSRADAHYNVGVSLETYGDQQLALNHYQSALEHDEHHALARQALRRLESPEQEVP